MFVCLHFGFTCYSCRRSFHCVGTPAALELEIRSITGVVDCGLFVGMVDEAYIGAEDGGVIVLSKY